MTRYSPGDVVLVRFPFTDLASTKQRPAVVINPADYMTQHGDVMLLALTSQRQSEEYLYLENWAKAGLIRPTWLKPLIATIAGGLITKRLGSITPEDIPRIPAVLRRLIAPEFFSDKG